jgi:hypothetical protein
MQQNNGSQLCDDVVLEAQLGRVEHRVKVVGWLTAFFFCTLFLSLGLSQKGNIEFASWVFFILLGGAFLFRLFRERSIILSQAGSVATIISASQKPFEAGHVHSVRYNFAAGGRIYTGKSGWSGRALPNVGQTIPILYKRDNPSRNLALFDFRFYTFNFLALRD